MNSRTAAAQRPCPPSQPSFELSSPPPSSSFREAILAAAHKLQRPAGKRRKLVPGKPHTEMRKLEEPPTKDTPVERGIEADGFSLGEIKAHRQSQEDHPAPRFQAIDKDSPADLARKTLNKLNAFRFELPAKAPVVESDSKISAAREVPLIDCHASKGKVSEQAGKMDAGVTEYRSMLGPQKCLEAISPVDDPDTDDVFGSDQGQTLTSRPEIKSPSPFQSDDFDCGSLDDEFDHESLEDLFQAAEEGINCENLDDIDLETPISMLHVPQKALSDGSDFGSDPFEPEDSEGHDEIQQPSANLENSFNYLDAQQAQINISGSSANIEAMLPPSYQMPRKSLPEFITPIKPAPVQPITPDSQQFHHQISSQQLPPTPFLRTTFPKPVPPRSPISNLQSSTRILTCFRTAEYLRAISTASSTSPPVDLLVELYATIISSTRTGNTQHFTFADLFFPQRPPHLQGTCTTWQGSELYEDDTRPFLRACSQDGRMCRAIVRPKLKRDREGNGKKGGDGPSSAAEVEVLNIWEAGWEDVEYVKGIVNV